MKYEINYVCIAFGFITGYGNCQYILFVMSLGQMGV